MLHKKKGGVIMAKLSYAKQVSLARRRLKRLKSEGISNNATKILQAELNAFYHKNNITKRGSGISIDDRMTPSQRKQISNIITQFIDDPTSTLTGIKQAAVELSPSNKGKSAKDMSRVVDMSQTVLLSDAAISDSFKSLVIEEIYNNQKREGFDPDAARYAFSNYFIEHGDTKGKSVSEVADAVMKYVNDFLKVVPEWNAEEDW